MIKVPSASRTGDRDDRGPVRAVTAPSPRRWKAADSPRYSHDFRRIPVHAPAPSVVAAPAVTAMTRDEARELLAPYFERADSDTAAAMAAIEAALRMPSTSTTWKLRLRQLIAACSLLDRDGAELVLKALTAPAGAKQQYVHDRFKGLDRHSRQALLTILRQRAGAPSVDETSPAVDSDDESAAGPGTWMELHPGIFAYAPSAETTVQDIAAYLSGHPDFPAQLAKLNHVSVTTPIVASQPVLIAIEYIDQPEAIGEIPRRMRQHIMAERENLAQQTRNDAYGKVRGGHPLGPGAVGLIPLTTEVIRQLAKAPGRLLYALAFAVGVPHGFFTSIKDTVSGIYDIVKSIFSFQLMSDLKKLVGVIRNLSFDEIREAVGEWADKRADELQSDDDWTAGHAHGYLTGYVMAEAAMLLLSGGALSELKTVAWGSKAGKAIRASRAFTTLESSLTKAAEVARAAGGKGAEALEALRQSRLGKVVQVAEVAVAAGAWTVGKIARVLNLPAELVASVAEKMVAHVKQLGPYFERIGALSKRAKKWLFGCLSPCKWEADAVEETMKRLPTNAEIEKAAEKAAEAAAAPAPPGKPAKRPRRRAVRDSSPSVVLDPATGLPRQLSGVKVGPPYATFEEAFASKGARDPHIAEVILYDPQDKVIATWWEASESLADRGISGVGRAGDTEQKALTRVNLKRGQTLEIRGAWAPCTVAGGCDVALQTIAHRSGARIVYRMLSGAVHDYPKSDF
jgi:hypothetical protein